MAWVPLAQAPLVEVLVLNKMEIGSLLGMEYGQEEKIVKKAKDMGISSVVITDEKKGSIAIEKGLVVRAKAFNVASVDDTGAGDAFGSGFVYGKMKEWELVECLKVASANGASVVGKVGAKEGLLDERGVSKWMKKNLVLVEERL